MRWLLSKIGRYIWNILVAIDRLANAILGGDPEMTLSGRMGQAIKDGRCWLCIPICWVLDRIDSGHCAKHAELESHEGDDEVIKL